MEYDLRKAFTSQRPRRVGFFGGTFDPIHLGHISLAVQMLEKHHLDQVLFCPAYSSPHKLKTPPGASKEHRAAMVAAAIEPVPRFSLFTTELEKKPPSYTIDTLRALMKKQKKRYFLILGDDSLKELHRWKEVEELLRLAPPLIGVRESPSIKSFPKPVLAALKRGKTKTTVMEVSSTEIRRRLRLGLYCGHLLPAKVYEYIKKHKLYHSA